MSTPESAYRVALLGLPISVLLLYVVFVVMNYVPYLNWNLELRSPELAGLPEDLMGLGFWMWWPFFAIFFVVSSFFAVLGVRRKLLVAAMLIILFGALTVADYYLSQILTQELLRG